MTGDPLQHRPAPAQEPPLFRPADTSRKAGESAARASTGRRAAILRILSERGPLSLRTL